MIELKNIKKIYKTSSGRINEVIKNLNVSFESKGLVFITGKSGSGKTTLLNLIGGLDTFDKGDIIINGKSMNSFKEKDYVSYLNKYVGFIFQDFNNINDYNVYDNITLPLKLQNKKINENEVDEVLKKLDIFDLKYRKINELSGGEQQRVAIARALIKKPSIILADEPTGSLDSYNSKKLLEELKKISNDILVIVVTHDINSALEYGSRIIELKDGSIIKDSNSEVKKDTSKYEEVKSKLPFMEALKLGFKTLKHEKIRLLITSIIITFTIFFLAFTYVVKTYNVEQKHFDLLKQQGVDTLEIRKYYYYNGYKVPLNLEKEDVDKLSFNNGKIVYFLEDNRFIKFLGLNIYEMENLFNDAPEEKNDMYTEYPDKIGIIEDNNVSDIIGTIPKNNDEAIISNYIADFIIKYGIFEYGTNKLYIPKNYEELINSGKKIKFGSYNYIKITGIKNYDLSKYAELKGKYNTDSIKDTKKQLELMKDVNYFYNKIYAKKGFIDNLKKPTNEILDWHNEYTTKLDDKDIFSTNYIQNNTEYYDGFKFTKTDNLKEDEMLLNFSSLVDTEDYKEKLKTEIKNNPTKSKEQVEQEFVLKYIDLKKYIGKEVNLEIYENTSAVHHELTKTYKAKVIGITGFNYQNIKDNLYSKKLLEEYTDSYIKIEAIRFENLKEKEMKKLLFKYKSKDEYSIYTNYSEEIESYYYRHIQQYQKKVNILLIVFLILSVLIISNFMENSVTSRKKDIGILKALGANKKDIVSIFLSEIIILTILSTIISLIFLIPAFAYLSKTAMHTEYLIINPFNVNINLVIIIFIYIFLITLITSLIPISKINKKTISDIIKDGE